MVQLSPTSKRFLFFIVMFCLAAVMLDLADLSFKSELSRQILIKHIKTYTGLDTTIDGDAYITISLLPTLLVERIHIKNNDNFDTADFVTINEVRVQISLQQLLLGTIRLEELSADSAQINLIRNNEGNVNWHFDQAITPVDKAKDLPDSTKRKNIASRLSLGVFNLTDVSILYKSEAQKQIIEKHLDQLTIDIKDINKPQLNILGSIQGNPYKLSFEADPLHTLTSKKPWSVHGTGNISGSKTAIDASLQSVENSINAKINIHLDNVNLGLSLERLGIIAGQDASAKGVNIQLKLHGSDLKTLYEQAYIEILLSDGYWKLTSPKTGHDKTILFNKLTSSTSWHKPVALHLDGTFAGEAITLDFKTNRLLEFFDNVQKLDVDLKSNIAGTDVTLNGTLDLPIKTKQFQLDITLKGKDLEKLNPIINTEFPPLNNYSLSGNLIANSKGYILKSAHASIGQSQMQASIVIETNVQKPLWHINLKSQQIQLYDFALDELDVTGIKQSATGTKKTLEQTNGERPLLKYLRRLEDSLKAPVMHLNLNLNIEKVLSGKDQLGKAQLLLHLRDNAFTIGNAIIEIPGGSISTSISLEREENEATGHLVLDIDKLDYGISTRLFEPDTKLDGILSMRIDLQLGGKNFTRLLDNATGNIDFAVWPKNTKPTKALNLWTTNLYLILLPELKKEESIINCMVGLMNLKNGEMKEEFLGLDATKLWIHGNINANFKQEHVRLSLFPQSKTARLFSLQTPIRVEGSFSDINMDINPVDLTGSYISFITSPLHVPTRRIFGNKIPKDGSAICEQLFDRRYTEKLKEELQAKEQKEIEEILNSDY